MPTPFVTTIIADPSHIDEFGHVNNAVWVQWIQEVASRAWHAGASAAHVEAYGWMVTRHEIDYRGNVQAGDVVTAKTWVGDKPKGSRFDRFIEFTGPDGKVKVASKSTWVIVDRKTLLVTRLLPEVAAPFLA